MEGSNAHGDAAHGLSVPLVSRYYPPMLLELAFLLALSRPTVKANRRAKRSDYSSAAPDSSLCIGRSALGLSSECCSS